MEKHILSKSTFIRGSQCLKSLYLNKKRPFLRDRLSQEQIATFQRGTKVGIIAQELFPDGIDARPKSPKLYQKAVIETQGLIAKGTPVIYEATFQFDGVLIMLDILVKKDKKWYAYEVKSSLSISETYLTDASLQYYVITNSGLELEDFFITYMNKDYIKEKEIDFNKLFTSRSVLEEAIKRKDNIASDILKQKEVFGLEHSPKIEIGTHCFNPYNCDFLGHCWKGIQKNNVFDLTGMNIENQFELYKKGVHEIKDIPASKKFETIQQRQIESIKIQAESVDSKLLKAFLSKLDKKNLVILDILSFYPAIPIYSGTKPYQSIPFSFIIKKLKDGGLEEQETIIHISEPSGDPRSITFNKLVKHISKDDIIICYNVSFLKNMINDLAKLSDKQKDKSGIISNAFIDIENIFEEGLYFHPDLKKEIDIAQIANKVLKKRAGKIRSNTMAAHTYHQYIANPDDTEKRIIIETFLKFKGNTIFNFINHLKKLV